MISSAQSLPLFPELNSSAEADPLCYESMARKAGYSLVAGVDEAGRGPLAGPVVAAAVIIPEGKILSGVKDSKQMTEKARDKARAPKCPAFAKGFGGQAAEQRACPP